MLIVPPVFRTATPRPGSRDGAKCSGAAEAAAADDARPQPQHAQAPHPPSERALLHGGDGCAAHGPPPLSPLPGSENDVTLPVHATGLMQTGPCRPKSVPIGSSTRTVEALPSENTASAAAPSDAPAAAPDPVVIAVAADNDVAVAAETSSAAVALVAIAL